MQYPACATVEPRLSNNLIETWGRHPAHEPIHSKLSDVDSVGDRGVAMAIRLLGVGVAIATWTGIFLIVAVAFVASHPL